MWAGVRIDSHSPVEREAARAIHLVVGMPANERMDWLVEKATELGVASIQPVMAARSVLKLQGDRADKSSAAIHRRFGLRAMRPQSGACHPPPPITGRLAAQQDAPPADATRLVLSLREGNQPLRLVAGDAQAVWVLHGPRRPDRARGRLALAQGWKPASLGSRVLRAETASVAFHCWHWSKSMSSCHLSLAKPEFYSQNFRVDAPETLPEKSSPRVAWAASSSMEPQNLLRHF